MGGLGGILAAPFGLLMKGCYLLVKNYGIALLIFTIITRLITLPLNIKQQRSTARLTALQPELDKLKQKYGKNQEKLNEETMKLYSENNVNPMASCLPMLIPIIILYAMIPVVYKPLTYITDASRDNINADSALIKNAYSISSVLDSEGQTIDEILEGLTGEERVKKLEDKVSEIINSEDEKYKNAAKTLNNIGEDNRKKALTTLAETSGLDTFLLNPNYFSPNIMASTYGPEVLFFNFLKEEGRYIGVLHADVQQEIRDFNYKAFGLDLGKIPSTSDATMAIPIASFVLQILTTVITQLLQKKNNPQMKMQGSMLGMMLMMSLFSLWIGFKFPCALGIYWCYSSLFAVGQSIFLNMVYTPDKIKELAEIDAEKAKQRKKNKGPSLLERAIEVRNEQQGKPSLAKKDDGDKDEDKDEDSDGGDKKRSKSQMKEAERQKLNEARRRYAEKYGDEYKED